ncbi:MAG: UDP-N-acetylglucosamine 2-epimerase [Kiloniellaceae bacterium]
MSPPSPPGYAKATPGERLRRARRTRPPKRGARRRICVVTVARSDYGIYRPLLRRIRDEPDLELSLVAAGMHLCPEFGDTAEEIHADGFEIAARVDMTLASDGPGSIARSMGLGAIGFAHAYQQLEPDVIVVLGDRYEMHAATVAAVPFLLPVAHIAGGSLTRGAIDDGFRHSITKLSHLHLVETEICSKRVIQMGEEPWRVQVSGALGLDNIREIKLLTLEELNRRFALCLERNAPPLLVTFHPVTREYQNTRRYMEALSSALKSCGMPVVFTYPNADTNGRIIIDMIDRFVGKRPDAFGVPHLGTLGYFSLMAQATAMVGNSSSGIIEAASFGLPVVNIGTRQAGRLAPANVIAAGYASAAILEAIERAAAPEFRKGLEGLVNPYGDGHAAERMIEVLKTTDLRDPRLIQKTFYEVDATPCCLRRSLRRSRA